MTKSPIGSPQREMSPISVEIVSEEEMGLIEAAFAATRSYISSSSICSSALYSQSSSLFQSKARSIESITFRSKRRLSGCSQGFNSGDIEDLEDFRDTQKKIRVPESLFYRFRRKRGLSVTDVTASEWCEKQMEFILLRGKPKATEAMKAGSDRHTKLEEEVVQKVKVHVEAVEDAWAVKFMNFIVGANQLLFEGLTRELPLIGFVEGVWMVGVIDEIRMPITETVRKPSLVDTKTRSQATLPAEPQKRTGRLQLMCYKYMWDIVINDNFPANRFYDFFGLNPRYILSQDIQDLTASSGFPAKSLEDLVMYFKNTCCTLPPADDQLLLRYEFQGDHSLLGEEQFTYDSDWLLSQINCHLEFWLGEREARYVPQEERWKCRFCKFASMCPTNNTTGEGTSSSLDPC